MQFNNRKFKLANATLMAALALAMTGCNDDDDNKGGSENPNPQVEGYVADKGFHIDPTTALFSGAETPEFVVPTGASTPIITSDTAVKSTENRQVVQFTTVAEVGLVAGFKLEELAIDSFAEASTLEFDLRSVGAVNGVATIADVSWKFVAEGKNGAGENAVASIDLTKAASGEWQHYVVKLADLKAANAELASIDAIKVYPTSASTVYNLDNVAIYPEYRDSEGPVLTLKGDAVMTQLNYADAVDTFEDPGYTVVDNVDDASAIVVKTTYGDTGEVDGDKNGQYQIIYSSVDTAGNYGKPVTRIVNIEAAPDVGEEDETPPVVTLVGPSTVRVQLGGVYTEQGATAQDNIDGAIEANKVAISGQVDVNTVGNYTITYTATDAAGNVGTATRTVIVYEAGEVTNLIVNGDFEAELGETWVLQEGVGTTEIVDGQLVISDYKPGASWQPRLVQSNVKFEVGETYVVSFDAKVGEARNIVLQVGELLTTDPWYAPFMDDTTVAITTDMTRHSVQFTAKEAAANAGHVIFAIGGGAATPVTLDNISVTTVTPEMIAPELTLEGDTVRIAVGEQYVEPGYEAMDNIDGDLTASVDVVGDDFDTSVPGTHVITYSVEDSHGNISTAKRTVYVVGDVSELITNGDFSSELDGWLQFNGVDASFVEGALKFSTGVIKQERFAKGQFVGGEKLMLSFRLKGAFTPGGVFKAGVHAEMPEGTPAVSTWKDYPTISADWEKIEIPVTLPEGVESLSLEMLIAGPAGQEVYLDDVSLKPVN
ncbi:DUF5011 domain-containing protein [Vibrio sp. SM6]|uniref:DUF5011 domain-containing protein n=1 Tax=Vibrio agarilyticus TaxID=2726741 RepID=A0A7X8TSC3_9VIBR|nr:immunoglobulin-like domain-containing protein [Vibrio agarilyticus]NLS14052.1 DUF5011 domain-containing protein [Vibrio agarilyticus]